MSKIIKTVEKIEYNEYERQIHLMREAGEAVEGLEFEIEELDFNGMHSEEAGDCFECDTVIATYGDESIDKFCLILNNSNKNYYIVHFDEDID